MSSGALVHVAGLQELLDQCQRRIRVQAVFRGLAETLCVLIASVVFACLLDYLIALPGIIRLSLLASTAVITGLVAGKRLIHPVLRSAPDEELGAAVDLQFPELQESLATLISIEEPFATVSEAGSLLMRERLQKHVQTQLRRVRPSEVVQSRSTFQRCGLALMSVVAVLIPLLLWPSGSQLLVQRLLMPFANLATPSNLFFEIPDGNRTVATNSDVNFIAIPRWRTGVAGPFPTDVTLEVNSASGVGEQLQMAFDESSVRYNVTLADIRESVRYRVRGGSALSEWFELRVADPPRILSAVLQETPPAYTGRPIETFDGIVGDIPVFERSRIEITLKFNKPIQHVHIDWKNWQAIDVDSDRRSGEEGVGAENEAPNAGHDLLPEEIAAAALAPVPSKDFEPPTAPAEISQDGMMAVFRFDALGGGQFEFLAEDALGLKNSHETTRRLLVTSDTPPKLTVTGISDGLEVRPDDIVPLNGAVIDDLGVGLLEMHFQKNSEAVRIQPAEPFDRGSLTVEREFRVDLRTVDAKSGDTVTFRVRAADERPIPEPQVVWKGPWTIRLTDDAEPLGEKPLREADQQLVDALRKLEEQLRQDVQKSNELKEKGGQQWNEETQEGVRSLSEKEQTQGRELQQLAQQVAEHPLMQKQAEKLNELAQQIREDVPRKLDEAAAGDRNTATRNLQESASELNRLREDLHNATDEIEKLAKLEQELAELNRLALEAQQLASDSEKLQQQRKQNQPEEGQSPEDHQQQLDEQQQQLQEEQQKLSNDLGDLLQRKQELLQAAREAQLDQAAAVAEQAQKLAQQQQQLAEGVNEEARDTARDAQEIANELQKSRNEAEQLGQQIQQQAQDVSRPEVQSLDEAIRELRQGNLASPQQGIERTQQQLAEAAMKLDQPAKAKTADADAPVQDENARQEEAQKLAEQNQQRQVLSDKAEQINERLEQLDGQLQEMAAELGAKSEPKANTEPQSGEANVGRSMLEQLQKMQESAQEQADALQSDPAADAGSRNPAEQAAQRAEDALRHAQAGQFNRAAERMRNAAGESLNSANNLNNPAQQDRKAQMKEQQDSFNRMADTVQQMQQDNAAQVAAQQDSQRHVAEAAEALPDPLNELAERLNLPALGMQHLARPAQEAAAAAQEAANSGSKAAEQLDQTQMQHAGQTAQETASHLNRAAQLAQQAAQGNRDPNGMVPSEVGESVNDALHSLQKAADMMNQESARRAAEEQAQQAGQQGTEGQPSAGQPGEGEQPGQPGSEPAQQPGEGQPGQPGEGQPGEGEPGEGRPGDGQPGQGQGQTSNAQSSQGKGKPGQGQSGKPGEGQASDGAQNSSAKQLSNAAKALQNAAKRALPNQFSPGQLNSESSTASSDPRGQGNPAQFDGQNPDATGRKGKGRMWGQLQDELDSNIGDAGKEVLDNEYSELIRRYRRDLARSTDKNADKKTDSSKSTTP